jgi:hypothetical protein
VSGDEPFLLLPVRAPAGRYAIRIAPHFRTGRVESVRLGPHVRPDELVDVGSDERLEIVLTLTNRHARVTGTIVDTAGAPRFDRRIMMFSAQPADWIAGSTRIRFAQPDTKGRFAVDGLPAGDCLIAALDGLTDDHWDRALLEAASRASVRVTVPRGETIVQNVMIGR